MDVTHDLTHAIAVQSCPKLLWVVCQSRQTISIGLAPLIDPPWHLSTVFWPESSNINCRSPWPYGPNLPLASRSHPNDAPELGDIAIKQDGYRPSPFLSILSSRCRTATSGWHKLITSTRRIGRRSDLALVRTYPTGRGSHEAQRTPKLRPTTLECASHWEDKWYEISL